MAYKKRQVVSLFLGGWGIAPAGLGNIIAKNSPQLTDLAINYPVFSLSAEAESQSLGEVGKASWQRGYGSLGSGELPKWTVSELTHDLAGGNFYKHRFWLEIAKESKKKHGRLQVMLVLDGSTFSRQILENIILLAERKSLSVVLHIVLKSGADTAVLTTLAGKKNIILGTVAGIDYLDNFQDWSKTENYYEAISRGIGEVVNRFTDEVFSRVLQGGIYCLADNYGAPLAEVEDSDVMFIANTRIGYYEQLLSAIIQKDFDKFSRNKKLCSLNVFALLPIAGLADNNYFYHSAEPEITLPAQLLAAGLPLSYYAPTDNPENLLRIFRGAFPPSNEEKFHLYRLPVTQLASGIEEQGEAIIKEVSADLKNGTGAIFIDFSWAQKARDISSGETEPAVASTDCFIARLVREVLGSGADLVITAQAAGFEVYRDLKTDAINRLPSSNPVPLILVAKEYIGKSITGRPFDGDWSSLKPAGTILDYAPTMLKLFDLPIPDAFRGKSLI